MSIQAEVTATIVAQLEKGVRPWAASWDQEGSLAMPIRSTGEQYSGINVLLLWAASMEKGFRNNQWMTFQQAKALGGSVRKGSKASKVVYASTFTKEVEGKEGLEEQNIPFMKSYAVFNCEQIDGLPETFYAKARTDSQAERIVAADEFLMRTGVEVRHGGGRAFYAPSLDVVQMPELARFDDAEAYYATLAHELTHATRHETRLNRDFGRKRFGDEGYAMEELVAELGAAFIMAELGLSATPREDHASYLASWLKVLKSDAKAIFTAASYASKAVAKLREMVAEYQPPKAPEPTPTKPRRARKARETAPVLRRFPTMGAARADAKRAGVQGMKLALHDHGSEGWDWSEYQPQAEAVEVEPAPKVVELRPAAPVAQVAPELAKPVKVVRKRAQAGAFVVTWADGSSTRVSGVTWSKDGDQWAAAYQAANRLRRMRARHTLIADAWAYMVVGACGISQLGPDYWAHLAAIPMAGPVRIELEGSTLAWGEVVKLAA